ncbi:hypothetical protein B0T26DRAFT_636222, partial [Lasiosphaeria miniovina]
MADQPLFRLALLGLAICCLPVSISAQDPAPSSGPDSSRNNLVGWQPNPDRRGTMNILQSCLLTIIACTWTIHHPNVPKRTPETALGRFLHRARWMIATILLPEFILAQAAKRIRGFDMFRTEGKEEQEWRKQHFYYANMGGFRVNLSSLDEVEGDNAALTRVYPLTAKELVKYLKTPSPSETEPPISETEVRRRIKVDTLSKLVAFMQIAWTLFSVLTRWAIHRATSQLEIMTVAFAACAVLTYVLRWNKPQNVE